jgi:transcriptional regulator GlxA family with amidase domain
MRTPARRGGPDLKVGIILLPDFTLLAFSGFVDTLRLAADDGDRSRQIRCAWSVLSEDRRPVRASCGVTVQANGPLTEPGRFDYLVVVGGTLHAGAHETPGLVRFLREAADQGTPLVGVCTGPFTLARAGLMSGRRACVSWFHHEDYASEFPMLPVVSDRLFLDDGDRITCAGGVSVIHLASHLVERHLGEGAAAKGLRIMVEDQALPGDAPQPAPMLSRLGPEVDPIVRRVLLAIERRLSSQLKLDDLAAIAGVAPKRLCRLFQLELGCTPRAAVERLRLARAQELLKRSRLSLADIAAECGFSDSAHLAHRFKRVLGRRPAQVRPERGPAS